MPGSFLPLQPQRLLGSLGRLWREWGGCPIAVHAGGRQGDWARLPLGKTASRWVFAQGIRSWAIAAPLAMAAKVDLTTSTDWKEAKSFLKGLNNKQRRPHYFTKDFVKLKQIPTWKEMAKSARIQQPEETIYPKDNNLNGKISLVRGDITKLEVDAIVNAGEMDGLSACVALALRIAGHGYQPAERGRQKPQAAITVANCQRRSTHVSLQRSNCCCQRNRRRSWNTIRAAA
ncbi:ADP-ribose glycohydrolase MACROD1 [Protobothrops mucrosquamatus]|uniref:ADP-ribose glycohydrolase MACROD1 n=1 Tax=Protobothrops mucrosquamatus TaxID=103944 RepID=UPI000775D509|nr:ADP-ribose glycohydrolase MACROD1 [Protobothrops mucrosquamatus]